MLVQFLPTCENCWATAQECGLRGWVTMDQIAEAVSGEHVVIDDLNSNKSFPARTETIPNLGSRSLIFSSGFGKVLFFLDLFGAFFSRDVDILGKCTDLRQLSGISRNSVIMESTLRPRHLVCAQKKKYDTIS